MDNRGYVAYVATQVNFRGFQYILNVHTEP